MNTAPGSASITSAIARARARPTSPPPIAGDLAVDVVVGQRPRRRRILHRGGRQRVLDRTADVGRVELRPQQPEVEAEVQLVGADVAGELLVVVHPHLADRDRVRVVVEHRADVAMDLVHAVVVEPRVVVHVGQQHLGLDDLHVGQARRLGHAVRDVDAEPVDAAFQPEPQRLLEVVVDLAVLPVEVGLLGVEQVQVVLAGIAVGFGDAGPGGAAEDRHPVVGRMDARRARCRRGRCSARARRCRDPPPARPGTTGAPSWCGWAPDPSSP